MAEPLDLAKAFRDIVPAAIGADVDPIAEAKKVAKAA